MIYFLFGSNSYQALRKIREFKSAFLKKGNEDIIEEFDGESAISSESLRNVFGQRSLFSKRRLVIFRSILEFNDWAFKLLKESGDFLKASPDIFVFWEREHGKEVVALFKKFAEKTQEVKMLNQKELDAWLSKKAQSLGVKLSKEERDAMIGEAGSGSSVGVDGSVQWALENELEKRLLAESTKSNLTVRQAGIRNPKADVGGFFSRRTESSPFPFVEKIFSASFGRALLALKEAEVSGQDLQRIIYPLLWKAKQSKMPDAYFAGILAESAIRRDTQNSYEILERFILAIQ